MEASKKPWPLRTIFGIRERIDTNPDYQRPAVWSQSQKQMLIDTMLRNYDVPKLYWRRTGRRPDTYDVVDGQQRLRAIWEFFEEGFALPKDSDPIDGESIGNCTYESLPDDLRIRFDTYALDIVLIDEADEDEVREMFLRLQNGTSLKAQEKRNAYPGGMRDFVKDLVAHPFFTCVAFSNSRFTHDLVAAQIVCLELSGGPTNIKNADLNRMYRQRDFDNSSREARALKRTLDLLVELFPEKTPELTRFNVISLYCVVSELLNAYVRNEFAPLLRDWFIEFEGTRRGQEELSEDEADSEWVTYKEKISHSTDSADSIRWRMEFMLRNFLQQYSWLSLKDNQRDFTYVQRLAIFRRDAGVCQLRIKCDGTKLRWDDWHCDHREAWSKGGKTMVDNGQVACSACNLEKGATVP